MIKGTCRGGSFRLDFIRGDRYNEERIVKRTVLSLIIKNR
ncbi:hypothetical protein HMPREF3033_00094 [Veillonellaceae bacterium DNF00751]|nr:hypothetical protein HMPREF3033_00094 [Veillonellaceae bacterium DNF00751]